MKVKTAASHLTPRADSLGRKAMSSAPSAGRKIMVVR
jgi:hypothetical protein